MTRTRFLVLSLVITVVVTTLTLAAYQFLAPGWNSPSVTPRDRAQVQAAIDRHIDEANRKSLDAIKKRSDEFRAFVEERKAGAEPFSKAAVSIHGKWRVLKSKLPFTDSEGHKKYVIEQFDRHIFTPQQLGDMVKSIVESCARDLEQEQNNLAVAIRKELLGRPLRPGEIPVAKDELTKAIDRVVSAGQWDAAKAVGGLVVSEVTATVVTQVLTRVGVGVGVLSAGAATSWWTLGAGLAIGFAVSALWDWIDDPAGDIRTNVEASLDDLAASGADAILAEMSRVVEARRALWQQSVKKMH
jgi:hypothetical protein